MWKKSADFYDWFEYIHLVHSYATKSAVIISQNNPFESGIVQQTYTLFTRHSNLENLGRKMIQVSGILIWNEIPFPIQDFVSISTFKTYFKEYYIDKYSDVWLDSVYYYILLIILYLVFTTSLFNSLFLCLTYYPKIMKIKKFTFSLLIFVIFLLQTLLLLRVQCSKGGWCVYTRPT